MTKYTSFKTQHLRDFREPIQTTFEKKKNKTKRKYFLFSANTVTTANWQLRELEKAIRVRSVKIIGRRSIHTVKYTVDYNLYYIRTFYGRCRDRILS